jgi:hypothetical protein
MRPIDVVRSRGVPAQKCGAMSKALVGAGAADIPISAPPVDAPLPYYRAPPLRFRGGNAIAPRGPFKARTDRPADPRLATDGRLQTGRAKREPHGTSLKVEAPHHGACEDAMQLPARIYRGEERRRGNQLRRASGSRRQTEDEIQKSIGRVSAPRGNASAAESRVPAKVFG